MSAPRIAPGSRRDVGVVNWGIARVMGIASGTSGPPAVFATLARHRRLFRAWLRFSGAMMPRGMLCRADTELVILRVAHNCRSDYEWEHHRRLAARAGLDEQAVARVREGPDAAGWTPWQAALLRAADELHADRYVSDATWHELRGRLGDAETIELLMLIGHYEMLAMTLNSLRVAPDDFGRRVPRLVERLAGGGPQR